MLKESEKQVALVQRLVDIFIVISSWLLAYYVRFNFLDKAQSGLFLEFVKVGLILIPFSYYFFDKNGLYASLRFSSKFSEILKTLNALFATFIALIFFLYFLKEDRISRIQLGLFFTIASVLLISSKLIVRNSLRILRSKGKNLRHVLLVGDGPHLLDYVKSARIYKDCGLKFIGWIDSNGQSEKAKISEIKEEYNSFLLKAQPDSVVLSYSAQNSDKVGSFLEKNYNDIIPIQVLPDLSYSMLGHQIEDFAGIPLLTLNQPNFSNFQLFLKRAFDFFSTGVGLILISPLLFLIALGVKLSSPGPILYGQERIGFNGRKFKMWKFRSMRVAKEGEDLTTWSSKEDPRKTKFGSFIRKTSIDELPQLFNVLLGDMSLVGPRPERTHFVNQFKHEIPHYMLRHKMKAGITGWAQVNGWRGDTSLVKRIECDIYYIRNWSFWFDVKIIFLTFIKGFINKNAY